jgi:hypothetical protein
MYSRARLYCSRVSGTVPTWPRGIPAASAITSLRCKLLTPALSKASNRKFHSLMEIREFSSFVGGVPLVVAVAGVFFSSGALVELADGSAKGRAVCSSGKAVCSGSSPRRRDGHGVAGGEHPIGETTGDEGDEE